MTERKPPHVPFPDWVERQIRTARDAGAFDDLAGSGKPIPGIDRPQPEQAWVAGYLRREHTDAAALLPPGLALAKEVEQLPERLHRERSEAGVRHVVERLNGRITTALARPQDGPPVRVRPVSVDEAVEQWRRDRAAASAAAAPDPGPPSTVAVRRRWWQRRRT